MQQNTKLYASVFYRTNKKRKSKYTKNNILEKKNNTGRGTDQALSAIALKLVMVTDGLSGNLVKEHP